MELHFFRKPTPLKAIFYRGKRNGMVTSLLIMEPLIAEEL